MEKTPSYKLFLIILDIITISHANTTTNLWGWEMVRVGASLRGNEAVSCRDFWPQHLNPRWLLRGKYKQTMFTFGIVTSEQAPTSGVIATNICDDQSDT